MREIFIGKNGQLSSKRILGTIVLGFAIYFTFRVMGSEHIDYQILFYPYGAAAGLLGVGVWEKKDV